MKDTVVKAGAQVNKSIVAEHVVIGHNAVLGVGEYKESLLDKKVYASDLVTIGENTVIPDGVQIGKNTAISGKTVEEDYTNGVLESGDYIVKAGESR
jgi:glucose-1-phosphate adenylyltransferase